MKLDLAAPRPGADRDGRQPALLGGDAAAPARRSSELPSLQRWTVMVQREIADRLRAAPGSRTYGAPSVRRPARLRGRAAADRRPGRVHAAAAGRVGDPAPAAHRARRRRGDARADPRRLRPPPQVAGALARARAAGLARCRRGRRWRSWGCRRTHGPRRSPPSSSPPWPRSCAALIAAIHAPAKLNLCLYLGPRRDDGLHELCSLFEPLALADRIEVSAAERDEVVCPGVEGENLAARALAALRERGLGERRRCGSRSRSGSRSPPGSAAAAPMPPRSCGWRAGEVPDLDGRSRPSSAPTCPRSSSRRWRWSAAPASGSSRCRTPRRTPRC